MTDENNLINDLKQKGLTCSRLRSLADKQMRDAKDDRKDAMLFRSLNFNNLADSQDRIAKAQEESAESIKQLQKKVCLLR